MSWFLDVDPDAGRLQCKSCEGNNLCDVCDLQYQQFSGEPSLMFQCGWVNIGASKPGESQENLKKIQAAINLITTSGGNKGYSSKEACELMLKEIGSKTLPNYSPEDNQCYGDSCPCFLQQGYPPDDTKPTVIISESGLCSPIGAGNFCKQNSDCLSGNCQKDEKGNTTCGYSR
jgi:hypothetical protein